VRTIHPAWRPRSTSPITWTDAMDLWASCHAVAPKAPHLARPDVRLEAVAYTAIVRDYVRNCGGSGGAGGSGAAGSGGGGSGGGGNGPPTKKQASASAMGKLKQTGIGAFFSSKGSGW
jgi:hypothetical protein